MQKVAQFGGEGGNSGDFLQRQIMDRQLLHQKVH